LPEPFEVWVHGRLCQFHTEADLLGVADPKEVSALGAVRKRAANRFHYALSHVESPSGMWGCQRKHTTGNILKGGMHGSRTWEFCSLGGIGLVGGITTTRQWCQKKVLV
jgi:hypothetical protein